MTNIVRPSFSSLLPVRLPARPVSRGVARNSFGSHPFGRGLAIALAASALGAPALLSPVQAHAQTIPGASVPAQNTAQSQASEPVPPVPTAPANAAPATGGNTSPAAQEAEAQAPTSTEVTPLAPNTDAAPQPNGTENPYGLKALWQNGDIIARCVLLIMAAMSLGSWIIIIAKLIEQTRLFGAARAASRLFWSQPSVQEGTKTLKVNSPFRYIAETGIVAAEHHEGAMRDSIDLSSWTSISIQRAVDTIQARLQGGLAFLGTVGSTSPFIGLFGTVWGIYHALTAIGIAGQASIDKVAGPVGESLIMTAIGLATAVPAVLGYNLLVRRNKAAMDLVRNFAADIQSVLLGGYRHHDTQAVAKNLNSDKLNSGKSEPPVTITTSSRV